ncbi:MAG TPA: cobalamin-binding protein, partial [Firmicutes bacterium]|nr:cobalamin-binding protein [Bacillota bacterium]
MPATLAQLLSDLKEDEAKKYVKEALEKGTDPTKLLEEAIEGMRIVGQRFSSGEYFIPDLLYSGTIMKELVALIEPKL